MESQPNQLWGVHEVATYLGVPVTTLYQWRHRAYGPRGRRVGRYIRYDPDDVRSWFSDQSETVT
ncbi:helix-turn-helix transcriptional regulator [Pseudonocardia saturnea]